MDEKVLGTAIGQWVAHGASNAARGSLRTNNRRPKRRVRYDPNARDADADQLIQEGTTAERRVGAKPNTPSLPEPRKKLPPRKRPANPARHSTDRSSSPVSSREANVAKKPEDRRAVNNDDPEQGNPYPVGSQAAMDWERERWRNDPEAQERMRQREERLKYREPDRMGVPVNRRNMPAPRAKLPPRRRRNEDAAVVRIGKDPAAQERARLLAAEQAEREARRRIREAEEREARRIAQEAARGAELAAREAQREAIRKIAADPNSPLLHPNEVRPKVTSLRLGDFTPAEIDAVGPQLDAVDRQIAAAQLDLNDLPALKRRIDEAGKRRKEIQDRMDAISRNLRWVTPESPGWDEARREQLEYVVLKSEMSKLNAAADQWGQRNNILNRRERVNGFLKDIQDESLDLPKREEALRNLKNELKMTNRPHTDTGVYADEKLWWEAADAQLLNVDNLVTGIKREIDGPRDMAGILELGGPALERRQQRILEAVAIAQERGELKELRDDLADELSALGQRETPQRGEAGLQVRLQNNRRRFLEQNIRNIDQAMRGEGPSRRFSLYGEARSGRPEILGTLGDVNGVRAIENPNIKTADDAIAHIRNGGRLDEIPNALIGAAIIGNSNDSPDDKNSIFYEANKNGGAIGYTRIFNVRDADGKATNFGYVLKAAANEDTIAEIVSQHMMVNHGFPVEAAAWDGQIKDIDPGRRAGENAFAVLPLAFNAVPGEEVAKAGGRYENFDVHAFDGMPDKGLPQRLHHVLHNYMLNVADRHPGNGLTVSGDGVVYAIPIDQGWAHNPIHSQAVDRSPEEYLARSHRNSPMDPNLFNEINRLASKDPNTAEAIRNVYDGMIERGQEIVDGGVENLISSIAPGAVLDLSVVRPRIEQIFKGYQRRLELLKSNRDSIYRRYGLEAR